MSKALKAERPELSAKEIADQIYLDLRQQWARDSIYVNLDSSCYDEARSRARKKDWENIHKKQLQSIKENFIEAIKQSPIPLSKKR